MLLESERFATLVTATTQRGLCASVVVPWSHYLFRIPAWWAARSIGAKIEFVSKMVEELVLMHDAGLLNDEELLLFDNANRKRNPHVTLSYRKYDHFVLEDMDENQCLDMDEGQCFKKEGIYNLTVALRLPEVFRCANGVVVDLSKLYASVSNFDRTLVGMQT